MHHIVYPTPMQWAAMTERERIAWEVNLGKFLEAVAPRHASTGGLYQQMKPTIRVKAPTRSTP